MKCEIKNSNHCRNNSENSFECKKHLHNLFFTDKFNAFDYAYAKKNFNLLRFLIRNIKVINMNDPDFINHAIFSEFFTDQGYQVILEELE